jgi:hypothetical protein
MVRTKPVYGAKHPIYLHSVPSPSHKYVLNQIRRYLDPDILKPASLLYSTPENSDLVDKKVSTLWSLSSADQFSTSYSAKQVELDKAWSKIAELKDIERRSAYKSTTTEPGEFLEIEDVDKILATLADPSKKSTEALYAAAANSAQALKALQDEHTTLKSIITRTLGDETLHDNVYHEKKPNPRVKSTYWEKLNPQDPIDPDRYERQKEALLYGYTYKNDAAVPDPFLQGGFVPSDKTAAIRTEHGDNTANVDGFRTIRNRHGVETAPRWNKPLPDALGREFFKKALEEPLVPTGPRATRGKKRRYDFESEDTTSPETDSDPIRTADTTPNKMTTRFRGLKRPPTRSASVTPLPQSQTASPAPKRPRVQKSAASKATSNAETTQTGLSIEGVKKVVEKNPNRSRGMRELWKRRKETGWVRKPKGTAKVDTKALAAAEKKAEEIRRNSQVMAPTVGEEVLDQDAVKVVPITQDQPQ